MLKSMKPLSLTLCTLISIGFLGATAQADKHEKGHHHGDHDHGDHAHAHMPTRGVVWLKSTKGNKVRGKLVLTQTKAGVKVTGRVNGLTPGEHGFHIHELGDVTSPDGKAAGGHFNPDGHDHGSPGDEKHHAGDLGNITADDKGVAKVDILQKGLKLHYVIGRSIVVHAGKDDLKSQPSGDAGPRVAVGVIGIGAPPKAKKKPAN